MMSVLHIRTPSNRSHMDDSGQNACGQKYIPYNVLPHRKKPVIWVNDRFGKVE